MKTSPTNSPPGAEAERDSKAKVLLAQASVALDAGQLEFAETLCEQALELAPTVSQVHEVAGDILLRRGNAQQAVEKFRYSLELDPSNARAEEKLGIASIALDETWRRRRKRQEYLKAPQRVKKVERQPLIATCCSAVVPGAGQLYNGDVAKGVVALFLFLLALGCFFNSIAGLFAGGGQRLPTLAELSERINRWSVGYALWILLNGLVCLGIWTFSLIEAPLRALNINRELRREYGLDETDPSKWRT